MKNQEKSYQGTVLSALITNAGFTDYLDFSRRTGIGELILHRIDCGLLEQMPLKHLRMIARALNMSVGDFIVAIEGESGVSDSKIPISNDLTQEITQQVQQSVIEILESLLLQLPTMIKVVEKNPQLPASRLVPLLKPLNKLLSHWDIKAIAPVGAIVKYDPQQHQLMSETEEKVNDLVEIRYVGYRQKDKLLYRARVSPVKTVEKK
ncbi:transcriptional regulator, XRE family [Cyanobacterium stanieri PCC 7202]|uniref:Transcriptional regulator, XRE family n=1 Tax=Cyanobacterium stanieri (strain ATCC 29140 / PCC 7202) TaxID=292563 RepID=K9YP96_CYASC|nr:transcriptional regulator, XRE family [Cyanobacterium stanieri PCC 7202]